MTESYTGSIKTEGQFETVESLTNVTFTAGNTYTMQIQNLAYLKLGDAVFSITTDQPFTYKAGTDDLYIKTTYGECVLTILENE